MRTREHSYRGDDSDSQKERLFEDVEHDLDGYLALFKRLQERAHRHGIASVVVLSTFDPMTGFAAMRSESQGNHYQNVGATRSALATLEQT